MKSGIFRDANLIIPAVIHSCLVWLNIHEKIFVIPFRITKIQKFSTSKVWSYTVCAEVIKELGKLSTMENLTSGYRLYKGHKYISRMAE